MCAFSLTRVCVRAVVGSLGIVLTLGAAGCGGSDGGDAMPDRSRTHVEAKKCLDAEGFRTQGFDVNTRVDRDAPDHGVYAYEKEAHAEIAFYDELARAKQREPEIRENAKRFDGEVRRIDRATIVWLRKPPLGARMRVERCVAAP